MRKFKSLQSAKFVAEMNGWAIAVRIWSEQDNCWLVKFKPAPLKSKFMAEVI
jgi:hypothetical protein